MRSQGSNPASEMEMTCPGCISLGVTTFASLLFKVVFLPFLCSVSTLVAPAPAALSLSLQGKGVWGNSSPVTALLLGGFRVPHALPRLTLLQLALLFKDSAFLCTLAFSQGDKSNKTCP